MNLKTYVKQLICAFALIGFVSSIAFATTEVAAETTATAAVEASSATASNNLTEDQIPLKLSEQGKGENAGSGTQKVLFSIGILLALVGTGYYGLKKFSFKNSNANSNMQIKILSQHYLGPKKSLAIIRVAGESMLVGVTDHNISMIKSLSLLDDELPQVLPKNFSENMTENVSEMDNDDFTFEGIKATVSEKIKNMKSIQ